MDMAGQFQNLTLNAREELIVAHDELLEREQRLRAQDQAIAVERERCRLGKLITPLYDS